MGHCTDNAFVQHCSLIAIYYLNITSIIDLFIEVSST